jgi:hypothetical protein
MGENKEERPKCRPQRLLPKGTGSWEKMATGQIRGNDTLKDTWIDVLLPQWQELIFHSIGYFL